MKCLACGYVSPPDSGESVAEEGQTGTLHFYKFEFDLSLRGQELANKNTLLGPGPAGEHRPHYVTLYACPECKAVQPKDMSCEVSLM